MYLILSASPNTDGLTAACAAAAERGIVAGGKEAERVSLNAAGIQGCRACGSGWGICRERSACVIDDAFAQIQQKALAAEGVFLITPVYWGQPAERMKYFLDRLRRCEAMRREGRRLEGKPAALVAAAGGSGNGTVTCLGEMELWTRHVGAVPFERVGVSRFNREQILPLIEAAALRMTKERSV